MLLNRTAVIFSLLSCAIASSDVSQGRRDVSKILTAQVSSVGTNSGHGSNIDHESALAANRETDGIGSEQQITVTYAGSTEFGTVDSAMRVKTPVSNATGRKS